MALLATPGSWLDAGSGVLLIALSLFVLSLRPRLRANLALSAFSACMGVGFLLANLFEREAAQAASPKARPSAKRGPR